jgi:hypothetical protein
VRREGATASGARCLVVILALGLGGCGEKSRPSSEAPHTLATPYELHSAEAEVDDAVLRKERSSEGKEPNPASKEEAFESTVAIKATHCTLATPGPVVTRMTCRVLVGIHELHPAAKTAQTKRWQVDVRLDPNTGALFLRVKKESASV